MAYSVKPALYSQKPNWNCAFKGATHIISVQDVFIFATIFGANGFKTEDGSILSQFCVIEEKPSNGPVSIANTFIEKPDWSLAFIGATHIISVNNLRLQKVTYHFAKKTGEKFANSVGTVFTNVTVVEETPYLTGKGCTNACHRGVINREPGLSNTKIPPGVYKVVGSEDVEQMRERLRSFVPVEEGLSLRKKIHTYAKKRYVCKFTSDQYLQFMNDNECSFSVNGPQSKNHPNYFKLFTIVSQHVSGDCVEECLDKAINSQMTNLEPGRSSIKIPRVTPAEISTQTMFELEQENIDLKAQIAILNQPKATDVNLNTAIVLIDRALEDVDSGIPVDTIKEARVALMASFAVLKGEK